MPRLIQLALTGCISVALIVGATGCGERGEAAADNTLDVSITSTFPDLDPHHTTSNVNYMVNFDNLYEGLVKLDGKNSTPRPGLALKWEQKSPTVLRMTLRRDVEFHDGRPFNAEAAAYSIKRVIGDPESSDLATYFNAITDARAVSEYVLDVETKEFDPDLALSLSMIMMVSPETAKEGGGILGRKSAGTGPYELSQKAADSLVMTPFDDYWGDTAPDRDIRILSRPEVATSIAGVQTGEVDIAFDVPSEQVELLPEIKTAPVLETVLLRLNGVAGVAKDPKAREAINLAIDSPALRKNFIGDEYAQDPQCQLIGDGLVGYNPDLTSPEPSMERAKEIVREQGLTGKKLRIVGVQGRYPKAAEILEAVASELKEAGFDVELTIRDTQSWLNELYLPAQNAPDVVLIGIGTDQWTLTQPYESVVSTNSALSTFPHQAYPDVAKLMKKSKTQTNPDQREQTLREVSKEICQSNGFVWLYRYNQIWGTQEGIDWDVRDDNRIEFTTVTVD